MVAVTAGKREVEIKISFPLARGNVGKSCRDRPERERGIEHLVVEAEALGHGTALGVQPEFDESGAGRRAKLCGRGMQRLLVDVALPVALDGAFQLATRADAGVSENRGGGQLATCLLYTSRCV